MWFSKKEPTEAKEEKWCAECGALLHHGQKVSDITGWDRWYCGDHKKPYSRIEEHGGYMYSDAKTGKTLFKPRERKFYRDDVEVSETGKIIG